MVTATWGLLIATILLVIVTAWYAKLTRDLARTSHKQLAALRLQWLESARPKVVGNCELEDFINNRWIVRLDNPGLGHALSITLQVNKEWRDVPLGTNFWHHGIMRPSELGASCRLQLPQQHQHDIRLKIQCQDMHGQSYRAIACVDLGTRQRADFELAPVMDGQEASEAEWCDVGSDN